MMVIVNPPWRQMPEYLSIPYYLFMDILIWNCIGASLDEFHILFVDLL